MVGEEKIYKKLKECEDRYRSLTQTSVDAIITADSDDHILTWNRGAEKIFRYGRELIGRPVTSIIPNRFRERHIEGVKRFLNTGEKRIIGRNN